MKDAPERRAQVARGGGAEEIVGIGRLAALAGRWRKAVAGAGDGVFQERLPADRRAQSLPAQGVSCPPAGNYPRDRQRGRAAASWDGGAEARPVGLEVGGGRRAARGIQPAENLVPAV